MSKKHKNSTLRYYDSSKLVFKTERTCCATSKDHCEVFTPNLEFFPNEIVENLKIKYFILDKNDYIKVTTVENTQIVAQNDKIPYLSSLSEFVKFDKTKRVYLRQLSFPVYKNCGFFFTDDVIEIIPIILMQQNASMGGVQEKLEKYKKRWEPREECSTIITKNELNDVLEEFDVKKDLITIMVDLELETRTNDDRHSMSEAILTRNRDSVEVAYPSHLIYQLFKHCVCGVNWSVDDCKEHPNCKKNYRLKVLRAMKEYADMDENVLLDYDNVRRRTMEHCAELYEDENSLLLTSNGQDMIPVEDYQKITKRYQIPAAEFQKSNGKKNEIPVWMARALIVCGWISAFYDKDMEKLKQVVFDEMKHIIPDEVKEKLEPLLHDMAFNKSPNSKTIITLDLTESNDTRIEKLAADRKRREEKLAMKKGKNGKKQTKKEWSDHTTNPPKFQDFPPEIDPLRCTLPLGDAHWVSNFGHITEDARKTYQPKYFILNQKDLKLVAPSFKTEHELFNLEAYSKFVNSKFAIRAFPVPDSPDGTDHVFTDDVLELIPILMKKQGIPAAKYEEKLQSFRSTWRADDSTWSNTISVKYFKKIMDDLNVDRCLITIIPDLIYHLSAVKMFNKMSSYVSTYSSNGDITMNPRHAMFYIFNQLICGVNWSKASSESFEEFKRLFLEALKIFNVIETSVFVSKERIDTIIQFTKNHRVFKEVQQDSNFEFPGKKPFQGIRFIKYHEMCKAYEIDEIFVPENNEFLPAWLVNVYLICGWMMKFCSVGLWKILLQELVVCKFPPNSQHQRNHFLKELTEWTMRRSLEKNIPKLVAEEENKKAIKAAELKAQEKEKRRIKEEEERKQKLALEAAPEPEVFKTPRETPEPSETPEPPQKSSLAKISKPSSSESKQCEKCKRNVEKRSEAQIAMEAAVKKADKYEEKALKAMDIEKNNKKLRKEMEDLKKELESVKGELTDSKKEGEKLKEENRKLKEDVEDLRGQVRNEKQETINGQQQIAMLNQRIDRIHLQFGVKISYLEEELKKKDATIWKLQRRPGKATQHHRAPSPSEELSTTPSTPDEPPLSERGHLLKWRKHKDDINKDLVLDEQIKMIEKLISITEDHGTRRIAEYELARMKGSKNIYLETVEMNIQKIVKTDDVTDLLPLPKYPSLTQKFVEEFKKEQKKQPQLADTGFSTSTNCYMCLEPYVDGDKKVYCKECKNSVHLECEEEWKKAQKELLKKDEECGYCRDKKNKDKGTEKK